ncbi:sulfatase [Candidatus Altiarchaeota archaeon]
MLISVVAGFYLFVLPFLTGSGSSREQASCIDCNVILITIDSIRQDHLGYMGYARDTSPALDVVFTHAFSQSSFTPPSLASMMTSLYVSDHGLKKWGKLSDNHTTLAEVLAEAGYDTFAVTRVPKLFEQNLDQGFRETMQGNYWRADDFNNAALDWLDTREDGKFFMWLHYYDPHRRYEPPAPYDKKFNPLYRARRDVQRRDKNFFQNFWSGKINISKKHQWDLITQYDGEIAYNDQQLGLLLGNLSERGLLEDTIVVISADHGESLNEHPGKRKQMFVHDPLLFDTVVNIPLIFWGTSIPKGYEVGGLVESIDIAPTILSIIGVNHSGIMQGRSLKPAIAGKEFHGKNEVYSECWGWEELKMVRSKRYKYVRDIAKDKHVLYDLLRDPGEKHDVLKAEGKVAAEYGGLMDAFMTRHIHTPAPESNLSEDLERRLRELGYIY